MWPLVLAGLFLGGCASFRGREKVNYGKGSGPASPSPLPSQPAQPTPAPSQPAQSTSEICANGYCEIPGGTFQIGSKDGHFFERPVKTVTMTGYLMGQTEVSVGQYRAFLEKNAQRLKGVISGAPDFDENKKGDNYPVVGLNFDEQRAYCQAQGGDLPTAAQLHFASRYDEQDSFNGKAVTQDNGFQSTEPVNGGYKNRFGVYNLLGNALEASRDRFEYESNSPENVYKLFRIFTHGKKESGFYVRMGSQDPHNPLTDQGTQLQEISGGSFFVNRVRPSSRDVTIPYKRVDTLGFRCARPLPQDPTPQPKD